MPEAEDELGVAPGRVPLHDVPEDRLRPDRDHRLRDSLRRLAHANAEAAAEDHDLHAAPARPRSRCARAVAGLDDRGQRNRDDQLPAPLADVPELRRDLVDEVPRQDEQVVGTRLGDPLERMDRDVRPRREQTVLVRVAVDRVVEEIGADAAVVQERVALAGSAVPDDLLPLAAELDEEIEECALRLLHLLGEARVALGRAEPLALLACEQRGNRVAQSDAALRSCWA